MVTFSEEIIIEKLNFVRSNNTKKQNVSQIHAFEMIFIRTEPGFKYHYIS